MSGLARAKPRASIVVFLCLAVLACACRSDSFRPLRFGVSVAVEGETVAVGGEEVDAAGNRSGTVYVYECPKGDCRQEARLSVPEALVEDLFASIDLEGDRLVVGAQHGDIQGKDSGAVYVFDRRRGIWTETARLTASDGAAGDQFGLTVSVSGDVVAVGARLADFQGTNSGRGYVFEWRTGTWTEVQKIDARDAEEGDLFGRAAIDGGVLVMSADFDDDRGPNSGSAHVFARRDGEFVEEAKLLAHDGAEGDELGITLDVLGDTVVLGAVGRDGLGKDSGAAYVFERRKGRWHETSRLDARDGAKGDLLGWSVAVGGDTVVVGAPGHDGAVEDSGAAYVYERTGEGWVETAKLTPSDGTPRSRFGHSVAVSADTIVVGQFGDPKLHALGAAYVFGRGEDGWHEVTRLAAE